MSKETEFSGKAERLLAVVQYLFSAKTAVSPLELSDKYGISLRSIERYFEILRNRFSFPIIEERDGKRRFYRVCMSSFSFGSDPLSSGEIEALYLVNQLVKLLPGTHFISGMKKLFERIEPSVPPESRSNLSTGIRVHTGPVTDLSAWSETISILTKAIRLRKKIMLIYTSRSGGEKTKQYALSPYTLFFHPEGLYLIGKKDGESGIRVWAVHRMSSAIILKEYCQKDPDFDFEKQFSLSLGAFQGGRGEEVFLRVRGQAFKAFRVMRLPPITKKVFPSKGVMELSFKVAGLEELKRLVLSYPEDVEVLAPAKFRKDIARSLKAGLDKYDY
jgi:predicted DNA-binding transcriptional regulator YafY